MSNDLIQNIFMQNKDSSPSHLYYLVS